MDKRILYKELASTIQARANCLKSNNAEWLAKHTERIHQLVDLLPSGSGWDNGTKIDLDASHANKIVLYGGFHHMNDGGFYDGWTEHTITVTPSLAFGFDLRISGRNRNDIKEYLHEMFSHALRQEIVWDAQTEKYIAARYLKPEIRCGQCGNFYPPSDKQLWEEPCE
jgi:hypothetical protein